MSLLEYQSRVSIWLSILIADSILTDEAWRGATLQGQSMGNARVWRAFIWDAPRSTLSLANIRNYSRRYVLIYRHRSIMLRRRDASVPGPHTALRMVVDASHVSPLPRSPWPCFLIPPRVSTARALWLRLTGDVHNRLAQFCDETSLSRCSQLEKRIFQICQSKQQLWIF